MDRFLRISRQASHFSLSNNSHSNNHTKTSSHHRWSRSLKRRVPHSIVKGRDSLLDIINNHNAEELENVLNTGIEFKALDPNGKVLLRAVELGYTDMVVQLINANVDIYATGDGHLTPLHLAAKLGFNGITSVLLNHRARINEPSKYEKRTALHMAIAEDHHLVVDLLLASDADVNAKDIYGHTPLHLSCRLGRCKQVQVLLDAGAGVDEMNNDGWTGLHMAAECGQVEVVKQLLKHNANVNAQTKYGSSPLHWSCKRGHIKISTLLAESGANLNIADCHGNKPDEVAKCADLKRYLGNFQRNRASVRFTGRHIPRLTIQLQRANSPFHNVRDTTLEDDEQRHYTSYEKAVSEYSGSSTDLDLSLSSNNLAKDAVANSSDFLFLRVPNTKHGREETDAKSIESVSLESESNQETVSKSNHETEIHDDSGGNVSEEEVFEVCVQENNEQMLGEVPRYTPKRNSLKDGRKYSKDSASESNSVPRLNRQRSRSVPSFITEESMLEDDETLIIDHCHHQRSATLANIYGNSRHNVDQSQDIQVQLFTMINKVNKCIGNLETKVSNLQLARGGSILEVSESDIEFEVADESDHSLTDNESCSLEPHESERAKTQSDQDLSQVESLTDNTVIVHHLPPVVTTCSPTPSVTRRKALKQTPKKRVAKTSSFNQQQTLKLMKKGTTDSDPEDEFSVEVRSVGSCMSLQSDIQDIQDQIAGMKRSFQAESDKITKLLTALHLSPSDTTSNC